MAKTKLSQVTDNDKAILLLESIDQQLRTLVRVQLASVYTALISTSELERLYKATGTKTREALAKEFGISTGKISMLWLGWEQAGLLRKIGQQYERVW